MMNDMKAQSKWSWTKSRASFAGRFLAACLSGKPLDKKLLWCLLVHLELDLGLYLA
jgi:hypothetical protein